MDAESKPIGKRKAGARWTLWLFGLAILAAVALVATHGHEVRELARLVAHARPAWLLVGLLLQLGTYLLDARLWQCVIARAGPAQPLWSYLGLGLAKLFVNQMVPSGGMSGTMLVVRSLDRRGIPRGTSMAAVVIALVSYYAAFVVALILALGVVWMRGDLTLYIVLPAILFAPVAAGIPVVLILVSRGRTLPSWLQRLPIVGAGLRSLTGATPDLAHDTTLIARCLGLQFATFLLDAGTLWAMLFALGLSIHPAQVFASYMLSTLARTLGPVPGGLGVFEAASVATLKLMGVPVAAGLAATLLYRGLSTWLPMAPGLVLARRETKA